MGVLESFVLSIGSLGRRSRMHPGFQPKQPAAGIGDRPGRNPETNVLFVQVKDQVNRPARVSR